MISVNDMKNLIIPKQFGCDDDDYENASFSYIIDEVGEDNYAYGASKFVIFPKEKDIVIKLPLNGQFHWSEDDDDYTDFVPLNNVNYCEDEEEMYNYAKEAGVEEFFAETKFGGYTKYGTPYYISTRVSCSWEIAEKIEPSEDSEESAKKYREEYCRCLPLTWLAQAIEYYGEDEVLKLINFIDRYKINDIHGGNVGYRISNGAPCIFDYSGFHS